MKKRRFSAFLAILMTASLCLSSAALANYVQEDNSAPLLVSPDLVFVLDEDDNRVMSNNSYYVTLSLNHSMIGLVPGDSLLLHAYMEAPTGITAPITWSSSDSSVATVDMDGRVYAQRTGWAVITASVESLQVSCRVHVTLDRMYYDGGDSYATSAAYLSAQQIWDANQRRVEQEESQSQSYILPLRNWQGSWNSIISYFDDAAVVDALDNLASGGNSAAFVNDYYSVFAMDFQAMSFSGDTITLYERPFPYTTVFYSHTFVAVETAPFYEGGDYDGPSYIYQATDGNAPYRYLMLTPPQTYAANDTSIFFHVRYENSIRALLQFEDWAPIMVDASATETQVANLLYSLAGE